MTARRQSTKTNEATDVVFAVDSISAIFAANGAGALALDGSIEAEATLP